MMGKLTPAIAQPQPHAGECYYLPRDRALEELVHERTYTENVDDIHFFLETADQREVLTSMWLDDLERQLVVADILYRDVLGLTPPLLMPRYQRANFIMVILQDDQTRGGLAYDEVVRSPTAPDCHIRMSLGGEVNAAQNVTPAHELFHLYQNAHMMFKQAWVHEGLARWSETLLRGDLHKGHLLPANVEELEIVMQESYGAAPFWQRLFYLLDPVGKISIPGEVKDKHYHDGSQVVTATALYGSEFLPYLFSSLNEAGVELAHQEQWPVYGWAEAEQRSLRHNEVILSAVHHAVSMYMPMANQPDELRAFMQLIAPMADR